MASFTVSKTTVNVGETVTPVNTSTGVIDTYEWTWGDGTTSNNANPSKTYNAEGTYVINLKVTGPGGSSEAAAVTIEVRYAQVTCPINGRTSAIYGNNTFTVTLNSSELAGRQATVQWLVGGSVVATGTSYTRSITQTGSLTIDVEVLIDGVVVCRSSITTTLTLSSITCSLSGTQSVLLNQSIEYTANNPSSSQLNGRTVTGYKWEFKGPGTDGATVEYNTTTNRRSHQFTASGSYTLTVTMTLSDGTTCIATRSITVSQESFTCEFDRFPSSATQYISNEYRVKVNGNTSGGTLSYQWYANGVAVGTNNRTLNYAFNTSGQQTIKVEVRFNGNLICTLERGIGVGVGSTDFCSVTGTFSAYLNQTLNYTTTIDSSKLGNRTIANVEWFVNGTSQLIDTTSPFTFSRTWSVAGSYELRIVATANTGEACVVIKTVNVAQSELECFDLSGNSTVRQFESKTYSISIAPSGLANVTYKWFVNDVEQTGSSSSFTYRFTSMGSVTIKAQVFLNGNLMCEKTKTVTVNADNLSCDIIGPNANSIVVGESYTFDVNLRNANGRTMTYAWFLGDTQIGSTKNFSYVFTQTGAQTVRLVVTPSEGNACERSFNFTAMAAQSISLDADRYVVFAGQTVNFTATTDIAPPYKWFVNGTQVGTTQTTTFSYTFNSAGDFTVEVEGVGVIRTQRASVNIKVVDYSEINVTFIANPWESLVPRTICFVPSTDIDESLITEWLWTFHDGSTSTEKTPCKEYSEPGEYNVSLRVTDGTLVATSTNKVRLYAVIDANATFNVTPNGGLQYCFTPSVSTGVVVNEFEFGDGNSAPVVNNGQVCHTYQNEGTFVVRMKFSKDNQQGIVPRTVVITSGGSESFNSSAQCVFDRGQDVVTYTINFLGQRMAPGASYVASYTVDGSTTTLGNVTGLSSENPSITFTVSDRRAFIAKTITLSVAGLDELTLRVDCWDRSSVSVRGECIAGVITFFVENTGSEPMSNPTSMRLINKNTGEVLLNTTIQLAGGEVRKLEFPEYAGIDLRLEVDQRPGHSGSSQPNATVEGCLGKPELTVSGICEYGTGRALFIINVPAGGANLNEAVIWTGTGAITSTGSFGPALAGTSSNQIAVTTNAQGSATFSVAGYTSATATVENCYKLTLDSVCWENTSTHTMRVNNANSVPVDYTWSVGSLSGSGTASSGQSTFVVSGLNYGENPTVSLFVGGILVATRQIENELCTPPGADLDYECVSNGVYRFTADGIIFGTATYYIVDISNGGWNVLQQGQITQNDLPLDITFNSTSNNLAFDVYSAGHFKVFLQATPGCYTAPVYIPAGYCVEDENGVFGFTITHSGGMPTSTAGVTFEVLDGSTVIDSGTLTHDEAASFNRTYNSTSGSLLLRVINNETQQVKTYLQENCYKAPVIELDGYCEETNGNTYFSASLSGNPVGTFTYTIIDQDGNTVDSGELSALFGGKTYTGAYTLLILSVSSNGDPVIVIPKIVPGCYTAPVYYVAAYCDESETNGTFAVEISDNGFAPLPGTTVQYEVIGSTGTLVALTDYTGAYYEVFSGQTFVTVNLYVDGVLTKTATREDCYTAPKYIAEAYCVYESNGVYFFNATNIGGTPITTPATFVIVDENGTEVLSGDVTELPVTITGPYGSLTMTLSTTEGTIEKQADGQECYQPPVLIPSGECTEGNGVYVFNVVNVGGELIDGVTLPNYSITDANGKELDFGVVTLPFSPVIVTSENGPLTISFSGGDVEVAPFTTVEDCFQPPVFEPNVYCGDANGVFIISVVNKGGAIVETLPSYEIFIDGQSQGVVEFGNGDLPIIVILPAGRYGNVSVTVTYGDTTVSADNSTCYRQPEYTPAGYCGSNGQFFFSITQTGGGAPVDGGEPTFTITGDGFTTVSGKMSELPTMPLFGTYENGLTMTVTTDEGIITVDAPITLDCYEPPVWTPSAVCGDANGVFLLSVQLVSGSPITGAEPTFTLDVVGNPAPIVTSGTISQLPASIVGRYSSVTLTLETTEGYISAQAEPLTTCYNPPVYVPSVECTDNNGEFTVNVINVGGEPVLSGVNILVDFAVINGGGTAIDLIENAQLPFTKTYLGEYQYVQVSVNSEDVEPVSAINETCFKPPVYVPEIYCSESNGTFLFGYTNIGGEPIPGISYTPYYRVFDQDGNTLEEGYSPAPYSGSVTGPYSAVTLTLYTNIEGMEVATTTNEECYVPPVYEPLGYCDEVANGTFYFEIINTGGTPLLTLPTYTVEDENGNIVGAGRVTGLPFNIGPFVGEYNKLTLVVSLGDEGEGSVTAERTDSSCYKPPVYVPRLTCLGTNGVYAGEILNAGGTPLFTVATYQIVDNEGNVLADGIVGDMPFAVTSVQSISSKVTLKVFINGDTLVASDTNEGCYLPPDETPTPPPPTDTPEEPICGDTIETPDGRVLIDLAMCNPDRERGVPEWSPIEIGGAICPDWLVYHTNRTGDWELFRLGELPNGLTGPENLSRGVGPDVYDMFPSRSPDGMWIAFASTRDTEEGSRARNWEIYVAKVTGDDTRRITYNDFAMDLDPVWAPDGLKLAYETTTDNGDWEIRVFDLLTGANYKVTNSPSNEINPFWSPDGTKLLIQSDREDGLWQIYELDFTNGYENPTITKLSDGSGDDHDPMYSNDGTKIVFRSYRDDPRPENDRSRQSAVYYMNADGTGVTRVSELGGNATNAVFSPDDKLIAYQSNIANGINDIYVYEIETGVTRLLTNNTGDYQNVQDTSPTWYCNSTLLVFTSSVDATDATPNNLNVFSVDALPITAPPINPDEDANRLTDDDENDRDAQNSPSEENASRHGQVPPKWRP